MHAASPALDVAQALWSCGNTVTTGELPPGLLPQGALGGGCFGAPQLQPFSRWQTPPERWGWGAAPPPLAHPPPAHAAAVPGGYQPDGLLPYASGASAATGPPTCSCLLHPGAPPLGSWHRPPPAAPAPGIFVPVAEAGGGGCPSCSPPTYCRCCGHKALPTDTASSGTLGTQASSAVLTAVGSAVAPPLLATAAALRAATPVGQAAVEVAARLLRTGEGGIDGTGGPGYETLPGSMDWALLAEDLLGPRSTPPPPALRTGPLAFTGGGPAGPPQLLPAAPGSGQPALPRVGSSVHLAARYVSHPSQASPFSLRTAGGMPADSGYSSSGGSLGSLTDEPTPDAAPPRGARQRPTAAAGAAAAAGRRPPLITAPAMRAPLAGGGDMLTAHEPPQIQKTSTYRGVSWCKRRCMWEAAISIGGKRERLGFYRQEDAAARAYDRAASWRNAEARRQLAASGGKRRRGGDAAGGDPGDAGAGAQHESPGPTAKRRQLAVLPLNLPDDPPEEAALQEASLQEVLIHIRDAAKCLLKVPQQPAPAAAAAAADPTSATAAAASALASRSAAAAAAVPASYSGAATFWTAFGASGHICGAGSAAAAATAAAVSEEEGQEEARDPGLAAAAALRQARRGGASLRDAAAAAGAAAAAVLHPSPLAKSSRFQGVCQCGATRWQAQVTHKRHRWYLGMHESEDAAAAAYDQGALCLLGAAARTNFPKERYDVAALHALAIEEVAAHLKAQSRAGAASAGAASAGGGGGRKRRRASLAEEDDEDD